MTPRRTLRSHLAERTRTKRARSGGGDQLTPAKPFQDGEWRTLASVKRRDRQVNGLLEHVLPGDRGVHDLIGEAQPSRARREVHHLLCAYALVLPIGLGAIVQSEHQMIVLA